MTRAPRLVLGLVGISVIWSLVASCSRRAPGTCAEDIDCLPGFDCHGGRCVARQRLQFDSPARGPEGSVVAPVFPPAPSREIPQDGSARDGAVESSQKRAPPMAPPARGREVSPPASPPSLPLPTPPSSPERTPMWKQRLKNTWQRACYPGLGAASDPDSNARLPGGLRLGGGGLERRPSSLAGRGGFHLTRWCGTGRIGRRPAGAPRWWAPAPSEWPGTRDHRSLRARSLHAPGGPGLARLTISWLRPALCAAVASTRRRGLMVGAHLPRPAPRL